MTPDPTDLIRGFLAISAHQPDYEKADRYATGTIPERFTTAAIQQRLRGSGDAYRFRLARKPITSLTNRVGVSSISGASDAATALIDQIRAANDMEQQEPFLIDRLATYGDAYWFVWPVERDDETYAADLRDAGVVIEYHSPYNTRAMYVSEDGRELQYVIRRWQTKAEDGSDRWHAELWYADRVEPWICRPGASGVAPEDWEPYDDPDEPAWPIPHDLGEVPFKHARTALPYGRPQHADAYGPQDAITKLIVVQVEADLEAHGYPERARLVDEKAAEDAARDTVPWNDDASAPPVVTGATQRRSGPGTETVYRATKAIQEFTPPDPTALNPTLETWARLMSTVTDTPVWEFFPEDATSPLSGAARREAEKPLRARESVFKRFLLHFLRDVYGLACSIRNVDPGRIDVEWSTVEINADPEWWTTAALRRDQGVPVEEILNEAGYLPAKVREFLDAGAEERFWQERVSVLADLAVALEKLSGPVSLGIIDAAKVSALVDKIMADAGEQGIGGDGEDRTPEPAPVVQAVPVPPGQDEAA